MDVKSLPYHVNEVRSNQYNFHSVHKKETSSLDAPSTVMAVANTTTTNTNTTWTDEHCLQPLVSSLPLSSSSSPPPLSLTGYPNMATYRYRWRHFQSLKYL
jgi:hypothetical protein